MDAQLVALFRKFQDNHCDAAEAQQVLQYIESGHHLDEWEAAIAQHASLLMDSPEVANRTPEQATALYQRIMAATAAQTHTKPTTQTLRPSIKQRLLYRKYSYLILPILLAAIATAIYFNRSNLPVQDVAPGYNQATLTLADGTKIALDSAQSGIVVNDQDIKYSNGNPVQNVILSGERGKEQGGAEGSLPTSLTLTTPKGGQYQIILSDGTKVWLNAASTLKYPSRFSGDSREVYLEGEAYFEVNNNPSIGAMQDNRKSYLVNRKSNAPFIVKSRNQQTTVLGTEFNINSYEPSVKTTLVTGAVQVSSDGRGRNDGFVLKPGEQSILKADNFTKTKTDIQKSIAWKNNEFRFTGENLGGAMQQIARWYDLNVIFTDEALKQAPVSGIINRQENLSTILRIFEKAGLKFTITGKRLTIKKK
ncbi:FecR family protein [bacterium A37T11]|nr:FecR family protein [bacterium A37T11]